MGEPYFKWSYAFKKNWFDLFMGIAKEKKLKAPFEEKDVFLIFKKMTGYC